MFIEIVSECKELPQETAGSMYWTWSQLQMMFECNESCQETAANAVERA
jgi:hypothetical protein